MKYNLIDDLPNILERFTLKYVEHNDLNSSYLINCGECFIWAWAVHHFLKARGYESELVSCINFGGHAWVEVDGLAYDSCHLNGVTRTEMVQNFTDCDIEYEVLDSMDEWESFRFEDYPPFISVGDETSFFNYWSQNGLYGYRMLDMRFLTRNLRSIAQCGRGWKKIA
jgi:hypothetical protein